MGLKFADKIDGHHACLNRYLNSFKEINGNVVTADNKMNAAFYILYPEDMTSQSPKGQIYRMRALAEVINTFDEEYICTFYSYSQLFNFKELKSKFRKNLENPHIKDYFRKLNEIYETVFHNITTDNMDIRQKCYIMVITSPNNKNRINVFYEKIKNNLGRAGLLVAPADEYTIQQLFNHIFVLPHETQGFEIKNTRIQFHPRNYFTENYFINEEMRYKKCTHIFSVLRMPKTPLDPFWLDELFNINDVVVSMQIQTLDEKKRDKLISTLDTEFSVPKNHVSKVKKVEHEFTRNQIGQLLVDVASGQQDMKIAKIMIQITGENKKKLKAKIHEVKKAIRSFGGQYNDINFRQIEALRAIQPFAVDSIDKDIEVILSTDAVGLAYPFTQASFIDPNGYLLGLSVDGTPILYDQTDRREKLTGNVVLFGEPGAGKSTFLKCSILGNFLNKKVDQTLVIDFEKEYTNLAQNFGQQILYFTRNPKEGSPMINVCELPKEISLKDIKSEQVNEVDFTTAKERFADGCSYLEGLLKMILMEPGEKLNSQMCNILQREIKTMYSKFGINPNEEFSQIPANGWPVLDDLKKCIDERYGQVKKLKTENSEKELLALLSRFLEPWCEGGIYDGLFNRHTNVKIDDRYKLVVFNLYGATGSNKKIEKAMLSSVMHYWNNTMVDHRRKYPRQDDPMAHHKCFICDEFHLMVDEDAPELIENFSMLYARMRKYYCDIAIATQSPETLINAESNRIKKAISVIMQNSTTKVLLSMSEQTVKGLNQKLFSEENPLSDNEEDFITRGSNMDRGKMILIVGRRRILGHLYSGADMTGHMNVPVEEIEEICQLWGKNPKSGVA